MNKENREFDDFVHVRHIAKAGEHYFITIIDNNEIHSVNFSHFGKNRVTFGRGENNDIPIESMAVDFEQGYFELDEYGIQVVNTSNFAELLGNNNQKIDNLYLSEGSFIKILMKNSETPKGVIMILSINKGLDEWKSYPILNNTVKIGSGGACDIILSPTGVAKHHTTIHSSRNKILIRDEGSVNGTFVNTHKLQVGRVEELQNLDVIYVGNSKMILLEDKLYYQIFERSIRLDAIDIVKQVRVKFKTKEISSHINMNIKPSEFVAFVGGSGAGKSTFMKCISGVDTPTTGTVLLNGENLHENYDNLKYNIGYVPQDDIVYPNLTLYDMLQYAAKLRMPDSTSYKARNQRIKEVLDIVQLTDFENSYIRQLSGGQRKRASIAVELIADPNLFFLDEPTSGLDPGTERSIMKTLQKMSRMGKTIILVTHNTLNLHLCDKVAFFGNGGKLCFYGSPQEALEFFEVDDFVDIYNLINEDVERWYEKFQDINNFEKPQIVEKHQSNNIINKKKSFFKQLINLIKRYIKLISNDFQQMLLLFVQAPIIALALTLVTTSNLYKSYEDTKAILFSIGCACIWLGLLNSVQEICKEKVILQKEYMADLKLSTYLFSKFIVQGILAFIQSFIMVYIFQKFEGQSSNSILIDGFWDIQIICFLSILCAAALGLFISSIVKNANIAMSIIPLILVPQLLFSGMLFKLEGKTEIISNVVLCRWTVEGLGTTTNLNDLTHLEQEINPMITVEPEEYFEFTVEHMQQVIAIILIMTAIELLGSYIVLRKNINKNI